MDLYYVLKFVHMMGLISLFGGLILIQQLGARLRRATTSQEARTLLTLIQPTRQMFFAATLLLVLTGLYMTHARWSFSTAWVVVALIGVTTFTLLGALVVGRHLANTGRTIGASEGSLSSEARALITHPPFWSVVFAMNGGALGILWIMVNKPRWVGSIAIVAGLMVVGAIVGRAVGKGSSRRA